MHSVYRINTKTRTITPQELPPAFQSLGNRGLIAKVMSEEVNPHCDPLGPENKLIISLGLFAGTPVPTANRLSVGGKSPLTGGIKEANVGGTVGYMLAQHGIKMLIFEDQPQDHKWHILKIGQDSQVELLPADQWAGLNTYTLVAKLRAEYGPETAILSIGQAGERLYKNSSLQATDFASGHPARAAGRGGLAAVAGSKKIKALVVEKPRHKQQIQYNDKEKFQNAQKKMVTALQEDIGSQGLTKVGTVGMIEPAATLAFMPVKNFSGRYCQRENLAKINSAAWLKAIAQNNSQTGQGCQPGCIIRCSNIWHNSQGEFVTAALEYETVVMCGPNCDIYDLQFLAQIDRFCDDFGIDTIEFGNTIAMCMEGGKIPWGDQEAVKSLCQEMLQGTEFGNLLGQGTAAVGEALGVKRIPCVKRQAMPAYDPRNLKGMGVTYATSPMGADHTAGHTFNPALDHTSKAMQVPLSQTMQSIAAMTDNMLCLFALGGVMGDPTILPDLMSGLYGGEWDMEKMIGIGAQTLMMEKTFNTNAGFTAADDRLPAFICDEYSPATGSAYDITPAEMADVFMY